MNYHPLQRNTSINDTSERNQSVQFLGTGHRIGPQARTIAFCDNRLIIPLKISKGTTILSGVRLPIPPTVVCQSVRDLQTVRKKRKCFIIACRVVTFSKPLSTPTQQSLIPFFEEINNLYLLILFDRADIKKTLPTGICLFIILQYKSNNK
jgi:hypothetical protein